MKNRFTIGWDDPKTSRSGIGWIDEFFLDSGKKASIGADGRLGFLHFKFPLGDGVAPRVGDSIGLFKHEDRKSVKLMFWGRVDHVDTTNTPHGIYCSAQNMQVDAKPASEMFGKSITLEAMGDMTAGILHTALDQDALQEMFGGAGSILPLSPGETFASYVPKKTNYHIEPVTNFVIVSTEDDEPSRTTHVGPYDTRAQAEAEMEKMAKTKAMRLTAHEIHVDLRDHDPKRAERVKHALNHRDFSHVTMADMAAELALKSA
jgi:hypothetical protein